MAQAVVAAIAVGASPEEVNAAIDGAFDDVVQGRVAHRPSIAERLDDELMRR